MVQLRTKNLSIELNDAGYLSKLDCILSGQSYLSEGEFTPLIRIVKDSCIFEPKSMKQIKQSECLFFDFKDIDARVEVIPKEKDNYITFEIVKITGQEPDVLLWGPYNTNIDKSIGESVGIVHDGNYAIGIQALNIKTLGGFPIDLEDEAFAIHPYPDAKIDYFASAAWPTTGGSLLQAFVRNRTKDERRTVWGQKDVSVTGLDGSDAHIEGSKIAFFGCPLKQVLEILESIEIVEDLPHPTINGEWAKSSTEATQSYLITDFSESTIKDAIAYAKKAGLKGIYHPDPFENWGHFTLSRSFFPSGDAGMKACVEAALEEDVITGVHTLTNFTTLNDPYVTPKPDPRLQAIGTAKLTAQVEGDDVVLEVDDPRPFRHQLHRNTMIVDDELIEFDGVSDQEPWRIVGCRRGINGTDVSLHEIGTTVRRLWDHPYDVFFPNIELQDVFCERLVNLFRDTGLRQISFDGLEGVYATGHEDYAVNRFVKNCYDGWDQEVINDASIVVSNYAWHIHNRFNWGEPWGAATREGQLDLRLHNQRFFARNFIPAMLGWFLIRSASDKFEATTSDEIEWILSKAAGFDAGFALSANMAILNRNGNIDELLSIVREWEKARKEKAFSMEQKERMKDPSADWHLESVGEKSWLLYPLEITNPFVCNPEEQQPGQPGGSDWVLFNRQIEQPLRFCLRVIPSYGNMNGLIKRPSFYVNGCYLTFDTDVYAGQYLVCEGDSVGRVYDENWNLVKVIENSLAPIMLKEREQPISFSCRFEGQRKPTVSVKFYMRGPAEMVEAK